MTDRETALSALKPLGERRTRLKAELRAIDAELRPLVSAAMKAGVPLRAVAAAAGITTNTVLSWRAG